MLTLICLGFIGALLTFYVLNQRPPRKCRHRPSRRSSDEEKSGYRCAAKPPWVKDEVIRLKALMPQNGCRKIAATFNHLHEHKGLTVGKSYVAAVFQRHGHEVAEARRRRRRRSPRRMPRNILWGLDLTYVACGGQSRTVLGLGDHGSRACLTLRSLQSKGTVQILRALLDVVERFGAPKVIRTDNEAIFCSWLFRASLGLLGIRHQRTAPFAPWQNGRIERFFGSLKEAARGWRWEAEKLQEELDLFRTWYNHVRLHQHLDGLTPAVAWSGRREMGRGKPYYFSAWEGLLTGFYFPE